MPATSRTGIPYPEKGTNPFYLGFKAMLDAIDVMIFASREDRNFLLQVPTQPAFDPDSGTLSWSQDLTLVSAVSGVVWSIPAGSASLSEGGIAYVTVTRGGSASGNLAVSVSQKLPSTNADNLVVIAIRRGGRVYFRNGVSASNTGGLNPPELPTGPKGSIFSSDGDGNLTTTAPPDGDGPYVLTNDGGTAGGVSFRLLSDLLPDDIAALKAQYLGAFGSVAGLPAPADSGAGLAVAVVDGVTTIYKTDGTNAWEIVFEGSGPITGTEYLARRILRGNVSTSDAGPFALTGSEALTIHWKLKDGTTDSLTWTNGNAFTTSTVAGNLVAALNVAVAAHVTPPGIVFSADSGSLRLTVTESDIVDFWCDGTANSLFGFNSDPANTWVTTEALDGMQGAAVEDLPLPNADDTSADGTAFPWIREDGSIRFLTRRDNADFPGWEEVGRIGKGGVKGTARQARISTGTRGPWNLAANTHIKVAANGLPFTTFYIYGTAASITGSVVTPTFDGSTKTCHMVLDGTPVTVNVTNSVNLANIATQIQAALQGASPGAICSAGGGALTITSGRAGAQSQVRTVDTGFSIYGFGIIEDTGLGTVPDIHVVTAADLAGVFNCTYNDLPLWPTASDIYATVEDGYCVIYSPDVGVASHLEIDVQDLTMTVPFKALSAWGSGIGRARLIPGLAAPYQLAPFWADIGTNGTTHHVAFGGSAAVAYSNFNVVTGVSGTLLFTTGIGSPTPWSVNFTSGGTDAQTACDAFNAAVAIMSPTPDVTAAVINGNQVELFTHSGSDKRIHITGGTAKAAFFGGGAITESDGSGVWPDYANISVAQIVARFGTQGNMECVGFGPKPKRFYLRVNYAGAPQDDPDTTLTINCQNAFWRNVGVGVQFSTTVNVNIRANDPLIGGDFPEQAGYDDAPFVDDFYDKTLSSRWTATGTAINNGDIGDYGVLAMVPNTAGTNPAYLDLGAAVLGYMGVQPISFRAKVMVDDHTKIRFRVGLGTAGNSTTGFLGVSFDPSPLGVPDNLMPQISNSVLQGKGDSFFSDARWVEVRVEVKDDLTYTIYANRNIIYEGTLSSSFGIQPVKPVIWAQAITAAGAQMLKVDYVICRVQRN